MQKGSAQEDEEMQVIGNHQSRGGKRSRIQGGECDEISIEGWGMTG